MSRLTGADAYGLMEAYQAVYASQELTEEQVWEEVETWVNDLIEEGYDLSDYTWEEMYESYIEEQGAVQGSLFTNKGTTQNFRGKPGGKPRTPFVRTEPVPTRSGVQPTPPRTSASTARQSPGQLSIPSPNKPTTAKPNPYRPGATVRATGPNMDKFPQLQRFANQVRRVAEPVSRFAGAAAGLTRITPAGVAAAVSAPRPTAPGTLTAALKKGDYKPQQGPKNPDQGLTKSQSFDRAYKTAKNKKNGIGSTFTWNNKSYKVEEYDALFSYILDEGYAETPESAEVIMANMGEEWISTILEVSAVDREKVLRQRGIPYTQSSYLKSKPRKRTVGN